MIEQRFTMPTNFNYLPGCKLLLLIGHTLLVAARERPLGAPATLSGHIIDNRALHSCDYPLEPAEPAPSISIRHARVSLSNHADAASHRTYQFLVPSLNRRAGLVYKGANLRLEAKLEAWSRGQNLTVMALGGSITDGHGIRGSLEEHRYLNRLQVLLQQLSGRPGYGAVNIYNRGWPGVPSDFVSVCLELHLPGPVDIVLLEFASNDNYEMMVQDSEQRRGFERLLRKLLKLPGAPAVVLANTYQYPKHEGRYWASAEAGYLDLATYYSVPMVSLKACCYHLMKAGVKGFRVDSLRRDWDAKPEAAAMDQELFYYDPLHPAGPTGHRALAELLWHLMDDTLRNLRYSGRVSSPAARPLRGSLTQGLLKLPEVPSTLPEPMLPNNYEPARDTCLLYDKFRAVVKEARGFEWVEEKKGKWGFVATQPGSRLLVKMDTRASAGSPSASVLLELAYLRSYERMGQAEVRCERGCSCEASTLQGHQKERNSQTFLHILNVSQAQECVVAITVAKETQSGHHKVKISGVILSEEAGSFRSHGRTAGGAIKNDRR